LGQIQYIPPGIRADLITFVATIGVSHCGHGLVNAELLSFPRLDRAVLLSFPPAMIHRLLEWEIASSPGWAGAKPG
jgi:hypothetical protein